MRLVDADALYSTLEDRRKAAKGLYGDLGGAISGAMRLLDAAPTIDPLTMLREIADLQKSYPKRLGF